MSTFDRLADFIQDYIYRENWEELRDIQVAACDVIFNTDDNLLLSSGTASGKTEAAFLPIITKIYENKCNSVGVLYISPLKALINDQFKRLDGLLEESDIRVTKWHGDANKTQKNKLLKNPQGIMQTTPESLEAMLMNRKAECLKLFSDLKYIVIDEVHYFMSHDRGSQLICILERIQRLTNNIPIRVGLSATLGDYYSAEQWLNLGTNRKCKTPILEIQKKKVKLSLQHFFVKYESENKEDKILMNNYYNYLYNITFSKKCIIFSNSKAEVEENISHIKKIAAKNKTDDVYLVHHGNVSSTLREYAEEKMKQSDTKIVTGATVTLELGIDLGELERIIQTGCPFSVSSFVQRLGRTGRRGNASEMWFVFREESNKTQQEFYKVIDWSFLMCIAIIQLYVEEKWIEPITIPKLPYGILYHQTMSYMVSAGEISPAALASYILSLSLFKNISKEDYKIMLRYLLEIQQMELTENKGLLIGEKGEREVNHFEFFTVFENQKEFSVKYNAETIGTIQQVFPEGERFALAGRTWVVKEVDKEANIIYVDELKGTSTNKWLGDGNVIIHQKIIKKMHSILKSDIVYNYLGETATTRLKEIRSISKNSNILENGVIKLTDNFFAIFLFLGTRELVTLSYSLNSFGFENQIYFDRSIPICIFIKDKSELEIIKVLKKIKEEEIDIFSFNLIDTIQINGKFNNFIPSELLRKQYLVDFIDVKSMKSGI